VAEYGFRGGESTVRQYVREHRPNRPEVVIPLEHDPSEAQVDWGVAQVIMAGGPDERPALLLPAVLLPEALRHGLSY